MPAPLKTVKLFTLAEMWEDYRRLVLPMVTNPVQLQECKRAFYAGASALYFDVTFGIGDPTVSADDGERYLEALHAEVRAYQRDVLEGRG